MLRLSLAFFFFLSSCQSLKKDPPFEEFSLKFQKEQILPNSLKFEGLRVGGLSSLTHKDGLFYALSDDKKNQRFYVLKLDFKSLSFEIKKQVLLKSKGKDFLDQNMDPEAMLVFDEEILIASEGQQIFEAHEETKIFRLSRKGEIRDSFLTPDVFWEKGRPKNKQRENFGQQENKGFESLSLDKKRGMLFTATEKPLRQDKKRKKRTLRLTSFDQKSGKMKAQYAYNLSEDPEWGLSSLFHLKDLQFLSLERSFKKKENKGVNYARIYLTDCKEAEEISSLTPLKENVRACKKTLFWDSRQEERVKVDNLEGLLMLKEKNLLILVSDNNFNEKQKTQFLFFKLTRLSDQSQ